MTSRADWVSHLVKYPMKELRRRQNICQKQIVIACRAGNDRALIELNTMYDSLTEAVMIKNGYI